MTEETASATTPIGTSAETVFAVLADQPGMLVLTAPAGFTAPWMSNG